MKRKKLFILTTVLLSLYTCSAFAGVVNVVSGPERVEQYKLCKIKVKLPYYNGNPNDQNRVRLNAVFISPGKGKIEVPAFCIRNQKNKKTSLWEVRFTPARKGEYKYYMDLWSRSRKEKTGVYDLKVTRGTGNGFLRKGGKNPFYPVFDSGKAFYGLGHNIGWTSNDSVRAFEMYFRKLSDNGCNLVRVWMNAPWALPIEDEKLGVYNVKNSRKIDSLLEIAEKHGIYIIFVLDTYGSLMAETGDWDENVWKKNLYNKAKGGPCDSPEDFFTNDEAIKYYKNRIRYVISRWSYSPHVAAFELWNEMDTPPHWTRDMLSYIKDINPHGQLLTTSLGYPWGNNFDESSIWSLKNMDILQWHVYGERIRDVVGNLISINRELSNLYDNKPILVGEFSMDSSTNDKNYDPSGEGVALHNSIWASALTRSFSSPLNWWWAGYVRGKNLYHHYKSFRDFSHDVNWNSKKVDFVRTTPVTYSNNNKQNTKYGDVKLPTLRKWGEMHFKEFTIKNSGDVDGGLINSYLHGKQKQEFRVSPVFHVDYPKKGKFIIHVGIVSQEGKLLAYLDNKEVLNRDFPVGTGKGPWKRSLYRKDKDIYQCDYDTDVEIEVPAGKHTIRLENEGTDWIGVKWIKLTNYRSSKFANTRVLGLAVGEKILLWIQNKAYNWRNIYKGAVLPGIADTTVGIEDVDNGTYLIKWWDPGKGVLISEENSKARNNTLELKVPEFNKDIACKIEKL